MSDRHYYAAYNSYGTNFTYDSPGWTVHVFETKKEREEWLNADTYPNGNPTREPITAETAYRLNPDLKTQYAQDVAGEFNSNVILHRD